MSGSSPSVKAQPTETWESQRKFLDIPPGALVAVHAGRCSLAGVHLHVKKKKKKGGSILFKLASAFSLLAARWCRPARL